MTARDKVVIVAGTAALISGSLWMIEPNLTNHQQAP